jgi:formylmethanofuran dehydrogenase subunit E
MKAWGAQRYWSSRLPEMLEKKSAEEIRCHICGKIIPLKTAIIREDEVLCEECYQKKYKSKKTKEEANPK